ncbi:MAG: hypothetical protein U0573_03175 [Phycisphaerales bacterium]|nr:hypothetical protein [Planctomycetota bacterium]
MVKAAIGILGLVFLGGCTVGYTVDVRNDTAQPIGVALMRGSGSGQPGTLAVERLGPGSRGRVSRFGLSDDLKVYVEVDAQGNPGTPPQMDLKPGLTVVRVTQDADLPTGKMHMTRVEE